MSGENRLPLARPKGEAERTTANLLSSLAARLRVLHGIDGRSAVGSLVAGFCVLGREVGRTSAGARLREALERAGVEENGERIWSALDIDRWVGSIPPSPIWDHLRNDVAVLLASDLEDALEDAEAEAFSSEDPALPDPKAATCINFVLGMWSFSAQMADAIEAMAEPHLPEDVGDAPHPLGGELLR